MRQLINPVNMAFFFICIDLAITFVGFAIPEIISVVKVQSGFNIEKLNQAYENFSSYVTSGSLLTIEGFKASTTLIWQSLNFALSVVMFIPSIIAATLSYFGLPPEITAIFLTLNTLVFIWFIADLVRKLRGISTG